MVGENMTLWQRFYKWIGGESPADMHDKRHDPKPYPPNWHGPSEIAAFLMWLGFLARDPDIPEWQNGYFYHMKWQWAFWRGAYYRLACAYRDRGYRGWQDFKGISLRSRAPWYRP